MKLIQESAPGVFISNVHKALQLAVVAAVALLLSGCAGNDRLAERNDPTGTYTLVSVNQEKLPATVEHGNVKTEVRSGTFMINADGTCVSKVVFVPASGSEVIREVNATYQQKGSELTMRWKGAGTTTGTIVDDTFTMNNEGMIFAYRK